MTNGRAEVLILPSQIETGTVAGTGKCSNENWIAVHLCSRTKQLMCVIKEIERPMFVREDHCSIGSHLLQFRIKT
jgi:hypothetical protein